jgi:hypothetical protein
MYNSNKNKEQKIKIRNNRKTAVLFLFSIFYSLDSFSQCAMCRAVLETEEGGVKAEAVNDGIVYLMAFPYILVGIIGYIVYQSRKPKAG